MFMLKVWEVIKDLFVIVFNIIALDYKLVKLCDPFTKEIHIFFASCFDEFKGNRVFHINDDNVNFIISIFQSPLGEDIILVNDIFFEYYTENEQNVLLAHQMCHIKNSHFNQAIHEWSHDIELIADEYAAKIVGTKHLYSTLIKTKILKSGEWRDFAPYIETSYDRRIGVL